MQRSLKVGLAFLMCCFVLSGRTQDLSISLILDEEEPFFFSGKLHRVKCELESVTTQKVKLIIQPELPLKLLSPSSYKLEMEKGKTITSSIKLYFPQTENCTKDSLSCTFIVRSMEDETILLKKKLF